MKLRTYGNEIIQSEGVAHVRVKYGDQCKVLPIVVTAEPGPMLFGRNWLPELTLDWKNVFPKKLQASEDEPGIQ